MKKRAYLTVLQLKRLKRELEAGTFSRFRIRLCEAAKCKNPIPIETPVEGEPMTQFCSQQCHDITTGAGEEDE